MNQLILGDCLEKMKDIPDNSIDMILADLPYNITQNRWDIELDLPNMWYLFHHVIKDNGVICLTASQPFTSKLVMSNINEFKYDWVWNKKKISGFLNAKKQPLRNHESILIFYKKQPIYNPQPTLKTTIGVISDKTNKKPTYNYGKFDRTKSNNENKYGLPKTIIDNIPVMNNLTGESGLHPTQKPVKLFEYLIKTYTNESDTVLDCCAGSGTTAIACYNTNRNYICIEKEPEYFNLMQSRVREHQKQELLI